MQGNEITGSVKVDFAFIVGDETITKADGKNIDDISIWAFELNANGRLDTDGLAAAYIHSDFNNENPAESVSMFVPVSDNGKSYRFFAVANIGSFGKIYKAREYDYQPELELGEHNTYNELSKAVFEATDIASAYTSGTSFAMPFSHWKDVTVSTSQNPHQIEIELFRPIAKTEFRAKIQNGSQYTFIIEEVHLHSSKIAVPVQGAMFSDISSENLEKASSPSIFGEYSDLEVNAQPAPPSLYNTYENNKASFSSKTLNPDGTEIEIGSACIYENNHGEIFEQGVTNTSDPQNFTSGAYYLDIHYSYHKGSDSPTEGTCYMPLPAIVRNHNYVINATFDMKKEGALILSYNVEDWNVHESEMDFKYPTITVSAVATDGEGNPIYDQPVTRYKEGDYSVNAPTIGQGAFAFYFKMEDLKDSGGNSLNWTVHHVEYTLTDGIWSADADQTDDFYLAVCSEEEPTQKDKIIKDGDNHKFTFDPQGKQYQIRLYPKKSAGSTTKAADIYITYPAEWLGGAADELLINAGGGGTLWTNSGNERYKIRVIQGDDIP